MSAAQMRGYTKIASFMSEHPEDAIFRRFDALNLQNLLYLQAEIIGLQKDLRLIEQDSDNSSDPDIQRFSLDWYSLAHIHDSEGAEKQWQKFVELRQKLTEYNAAIIQYLQLASLPDPDPATLRRFKEWLSRPTLGSVYLEGRDRDCWDQNVDLMALRPVPKKHRFARLILELVVPLYHRVRTSRLAERVRAKTNPLNSSAKPEAEAGGITEYQDAAILTAADFVGTVIASLLPILSIIILHSIKSMGVRLGLVALFSTMFSVCMWFLNDGGLVGVFAATSGFAAVQVVFIGTST